MNVAIIPARGGSQRIPHKNIRLFDGKPMLAYSIEAAVASGCFERIVVSTDDPEVARIANACGAETPFIRPASLADEHSGLDVVLGHAVSWLEANGCKPAFVCCVFATAPFLAASALQEGLQTLQQAGPERQYAVAVASFPFPIQRAVRMTADGGMEPFHPECIPMRSQDLEPAFHEAGQFFWGRPEALRHEISIYAPGVSIPVVIPRHRVQDIDNMEDWTRAEYLFKAMKAMANDADSD